MPVARRRITHLLAVLALPVAAAPARAEVGTDGPPADAPAQLATRTVPPIPSIARRVRYGTPGTNSMRTRGAVGVTFHGLEGADRLFGDGRFDELFGDTAADVAFGHGGADLLDGGSGGDE